MTQVSVEAVPEASPGPGDQGVWLSGAKGATRRFFWWGTLAYLVTVAALLVMSLRRTGGRLIYLTDDPAIHMSVARNLALHGTWGVTPGHFQSASSSPLWTVLLAGWIRVAPSTMSLAPLLLNLGSGVLVIWILANSQRLLAPGRTRPFDTPGVAGLVVCVLFLPALAMLGMEHTLHMALILAAVVLSLAYVNHGANWGGRWMPYLMVALATLVRFETLFVVAGLAIGLLATRRSTLTRHPSSPIDRRAWRCTIGLLAASVAAAVGFSIFNLAMGQGVLPNSVLAKAQTTSGAGSFGPVQILNRFTSDPVLSALWAILAVSTVLAWRRIRDLRALAVTALVAVGLHVTFAQVGFFERYEAYLIGLLCLALLAVGTLLLSESDRVPTARAVIPCVIAVLMLFTATKSSLTLKVPVAVDDTYQQRYQAGRFLARYWRFGSEGEVVGG